MALPLATRSSSWSSRCRVHTCCRWRTRCLWRPQVRTAFIAGVLLCLALIPINRLIVLRIQVS